MEDPLQNTQIEVCRICRNGSSPDQPLYYPCLCSGSIKYIHQDCLIEWLKHSKKRYCELCKHPFTFSPVYADQMPIKIPFSVLLTGLIRKTFSIARIAVSWTFAGLLWLLVVPIITSQIFRYYFGWSLQGLFSAFFAGVLESAEVEDFFLETLLSLLFDSMQGFLLTGFTVFLILGMMLVREFISMIRVAPEPSTIVPEPTDFEPELETEPESNDRILAPSITNPVRTNSSFIDSGSPLSPSRRNSELNNQNSNAPNPLSPSRGSGNYWLDQVHPKEYRNYMRRRELHREMIDLNEGSSSIFDPSPTTSTNTNTNYSTTADTSFTSEYPEDLLSNISGTTTLRSRFTTAGDRPLENFRCRVCSSSTCISREHVIQASRQRNALSAQRHQSLLSRAVEETRSFGDNVRADNNESDNRNNIDNGDTGNTPTATTTNTANNNNTNNNVNNNTTNTTDSEGFGWNLDAAESLSFPEFFGLTPEGTPVLELFQNASIVIGCNALVMHLFLFVPFITGKAIFGGSIYVLCIKALSILAAKAFSSEEALKLQLLSIIRSNRYLALLTIEKESILGVAFTVTLGYAAICSLLSVYIGFTRKLRDAFHRAFIPIVSFVGTFIKLLALLFVEMAVFPLLCGFMVDFALLPLFPEASLYDRLQSLHSLPVSSLVVHWALGAFFMISFASLVTFLRSFLRPGLLFFLRNPLDPDNHPIKEMVERNFFDQIYRLGISFIFYALLVASSIGLSVQILQIHPIKTSIFPLNLSFADPLIEIPVDLLLHLLLRWLLKHCAPSKLFKNGFISLCKSIFRRLKLSSYFLGKGRYLNEESFNSGTWVAVPDFDRFYTRAQLNSIRARRILPVEVAALKTVVDKSGNPVLMENRDETSSANRFRDSTIAFRPKLFKTKCFAFILFLISAVQAFLLLTFAGPLLLGRFILKSLALAPSHEVYTWSIGAVALILALKGLELLIYKNPNGTIARNEPQPPPLNNLHHLKGVLLKILKAAVLFFFVGILWPLQVGFLFTLTVNPLVYSQNLFTSDSQLKSIPIVFIGTCWSLGFPFLRILYTLRSHLPLPNRSINYLRSFNGSFDYSLKLFLKHCALPVTLLLSLSLILPPISTLLVLSLFSTSTPTSFETVFEWQQFSHLSAILAYILFKSINSTLKFFHSLYNGIRDETYLVGRRLHNLENRNNNNSNTDVMSPLM